MKTHAVCMLVEIQFGMEFTLDLIKRRLAETCDTRKKFRLALHKVKVIAILCSFVAFLLFFCFRL